MYAIANSERKLNIKEEYMKFFPILALPKPINKSELQSCQGVINVAEAARKQKLVR